MSILNIRIDERLIHGQVATVWTNQLNITRILVIDDLAAVDDIQKIALKMACPSSSRLSILNAERAVRAGTGTDSRRDGWLQGSYL